MQDAVGPEQDRGADLDLASALPVSKAAVAVPFALAEGRLEVPWRERIAHPAALMLAATAHIVLLAALPTRSGVIGDGGARMESIAVSIVADVPVAVGAQDTSAARGATETTQEPSAPPEPETPPMARIAALPPPAEPVPPVPEDPAPSLAVSEPPAPLAALPPSPTPPPALAAPQLQSAAPASAGVVREYAKQVAATLAKSKPKGAGLTGTLKLRFIIDETGRAGAVTIVATSGTHALDEIAVKALTCSEFPPPPSVLPPGQRTFEVPYSFR